MSIYQFKGGMGNSNLERFGRFGLFFISWFACIMFVMCLLVSLVIFLFLLLLLVRGRGEYLVSVVLFLFVFFFFFFLILFNRKKGFFICLWAG